MKKARVLVVMLLAILGKPLFSEGTEMDAVKLEKATQILVGDCSQAALEQHFLRFGDRRRNSSLQIVRDLYAYTLPKKPTRRHLQEYVHKNIYARFRSTDITAVQMKYADEFTRKETDTEEQILELRNRLACDLVREMHRQYIIYPEKWKGSGQQFYDSIRLAMFSKPLAGNGEQSLSRNSKEGQPKPEKTVAVEASDQKARKLSTTSSRTFNHKRKRNNIFLGIVLVTGLLILSSSILLRRISHGLKTAVYSQPLAEPQIQKLSGHFVSKMMSMNQFQYFQMEEPEKNEMRTLLERLEARIDILERENKGLNDQVKEWSDPANSQYLLRHSPHIGEIIQKKMYDVLTAGRLEKQLGLPQIRNRLAQIENPSSLKNEQDIQSRILTNLKAELSKWQERRERFDQEEIAKEVRRIVLEELKNFKSGDLQLGVREATRNLNMHDANFKQHYIPDLEKRVNDLQSHVRSLESLNVSAKPQEANSNDSLRQKLEALNKEVEDMRLRMDEQSRGVISYMEQMTNKWESELLLRLQQRATPFEKEVTMLRDQYSGIEQQFIEKLKGAIQKSKADLNAAVELIDRDMMQINKSIELFQLIASRVERLEEQLLRERPSVQGEIKHSQDKQEDERVAHLQLKEVPHQPGSFLQTEGSTTNAYSVYSAEPVGDIFMEKRLFSQLQPKRTFYVISPDGANAEEGYFDLVRDPDTLEVAFNAPDTHLSACELRGIGMLSISNLREVTPGRVRKVDAQWYIEKKIVVYYGG